MKIPIQDDCIHYAVCRQNITNNIDNLRHICPLECGHFEIREDGMPSAPAPVKSSELLAAELIKIAAEMVQIKNMPSDYYDDWEFLPNQLSQRAWKEIRQNAERAQAQCKVWSRKVREVADKIVSS
jgi:hypothetical protein